MDSKTIDSERVDIDVLIENLIKSLGIPTEDNNYKLYPDEDGKWWIEHKHVCSAEPLEQWIRMQATIPANGNFNDLRE